MKELLENWDQAKGALLEGLSESNRKTVSTLLENQKTYLIGESASDGSTEAHNIANLRKTLIPMIRRVIPGTIATELVGVQAMSGPAAQVFTLRHQYEEAVTNPGNSPFALNADIAQGDEMFGNISPVRAFYSNGGGRVDAPAGSSGLAGADRVVANIPQPTDYAAAGSSVSAGGFGASGALVADANGNNPGDPGYQTTYGPGAQGTPGGFSQAPETLIPGHSGHFGNLRGGSGSFLEGTGGRKASLRVLSQVVEAQTRKLQAGWTLEAMQDASSQHGLNIEDEMTKALSADIVQEIDQEIITDLLSLAGTVATFAGSGGGSFGASGGNYTPTFIGDRFANLGPIINYVANEIARRTRRGAANFVVVSPMVVSVLQSANKSVFAPATQGAFKGPNNTQLVGTLNGTIKVYSYLWNQVTAVGTDYNGVIGTGNDVILVGYKGGNNETDAGYFYCPYIPLMSSGTVYNAVTHQPVMSVMTRYAKAVFTSTATSLGNSSDYYGKVIVDQLDFA